MTTGSMLLDASNLLRDYAVRLSEDLDAARKRSRDASRNWHQAQDDIRRASFIEGRLHSIHAVADELGRLDPYTVDSWPHALATVRALAADLVHQLGRLERDPDAMRRASAITPGQARTLDVVTDRVVAYLRVSTDRQADEGLGLEVQEAAIREWARKHRARVAFVVRDEGKSGAADVIDRPGLAESLGHVQAGRAKAVVVARLDRLARDLVLQEWIRADLIRAGGELRSASSIEDLYLRDDPEDPTGTLVRQILGAVAQYERAMIRLRMEAGKARKKQAGGYAGGQPPYGYRAADRDLIPAIDEQREIKRIKRWRRDGDSLRQIATKLNDEGVPSRRGRWHPQTVARVLDRAS